MRQLFFWISFIPLVIVGFLLIVSGGGLGFVLFCVMAFAYGFYYNRIYTAVTRKK